MNASARSWRGRTGTGWGPGCTCRTRCRIGHIQCAVESQHFQVPGQSFLEGWAEGEVVAILPYSLLLSHPPPPPLSRPPPPFRWALLQPPHAFVAVGCGVAFPRGLDLLSSPLLLSTPVTLFRVVGVSFGPLWGCSLPPPSGPRTPFSVLCSPIFFCVRLSGSPPPSSRRFPFSLPFSPLFLFFLFMFSHRCSGS